MKRIDRFIEIISKNVATDFNRLLKEVREGEAEATVAKAQVVEMVEAAFNTVIGSVRCPKKGIGGRKYWYKKSIKDSE